MTIARPHDHAAYTGGDLLDGIPMPVVVTAEDGRIKYCNRTGHELFGQASDGKPGQPFASLFADPDSKPRVDAALSALIPPSSQRTRPPSLDLNCRLPDGSLQLLSWTAEAIDGPDGTTVIFTGLSPGGTAQLSRQLQEARLRTRALSAASTDCIVIVDADGVIESVNPATESLFGYPATELVGRGIDVFLDWHSEHERLTWLDRVLYHPSLGRRGSDNEFTAKRRDGDTFPCDLAMVVQAIAGHQLQILVMRNASERRRAEQEMARMRLDLKSIIDSMPSILVSVDGLCAVTAWNKEAQRSTGVPARHALGRPFREFFPDLDEYLGEVRAAVQEHRRVDSRRISVQRNGRLRYLEVMVYPLLARGSQGAVIRVDDVSTRVRLEQTMVLTEKMRSVGGLAAGMAHEINNPLGAIAGATQNIERRISEDLPRNQVVADSLEVDLAAVRRYLEARGVPGFLEAIREAAGRASRIVTDMLSFSRRSETRYKPHALAEIADTALRLATSDYDLKKRYGFRHVRLLRRLEPDLPPLVCDATGVEQVVLNLIRNAAQAMTLAGTEDPRIIITSGRRGERLWLSVEDNGPGIDEEVRKRVFEPFFTTKEVGVGTGLGLSVSYFIITEQHRGSLRVETRAGHGARFVIELPIAGAPPGVTSEQ